MSAPARAWLAAACLAGASTAAADDGVLFDGKGLFGRVLVEQRDGLRILSLGEPPTPQSAARPGDPAYLHYEYARLATGVLAFVPQPRRVLVVGLGGGTIPLFLRRLFPAATIDAVELDPAVAEAARRFFGVTPDERLRVHVADGRAFLERTRERWDLLFLDAYAPDFVPPALATQEFFAIVRARLAPGGAAVANVWGPPSEAYPRLRRTLAAAFPGLVELGGRIDTNHLFFAFDRPVTATRAEVAAKASSAAKAHALGFDLGAIVQASWLGPVETDATLAPLTDPKTAPR